MQKRVKIPHKTEVKVLVTNKHTCCICRDFKSSENVQIHHMDGNRNNNDLKNLAVLCKNHHEMADIGLNKGKIGVTKKYTPDEIRRYKKDWERKVENEIKVERRVIPARERKMLETLYKFEISKRKNEILSLPRKQQQTRKDNYEFLQQLVVEEFITGLRLRPILLKAFGEIAIQSGGDNYISLPLIEAIRGVFLHLIGPEDVKIDADDKKLLLESLNELETIGSYGASISDDKESRVLREVCSTIYELAEISSWYKFSDFLTKSRRELNKIRKHCFEYEPIQKSNNKERLIKKRIKIVEDTIQSIKRLK